MVKLAGPRPYPKICGLHGTLHKCLLCMYPEDKSSKEEPMTVQTDIKQHTEIKVTSANIECTYQSILDEGICLKKSDNVFAIWIAPDEIDDAIKALQAVKDAIEGEKK